jgi:hypothetical protein
MQLKQFYTLLFLLCLSTVASSNERARFCCPRAAGDSVRKVKVKVSVPPIATSLPILRLLSI